MKRIALIMGVLLLAGCGEPMPEPKRDPDGTVVYNLKWSSIYEDTKTGCRYGYAHNLGIIPIHNSDGTLQCPDVAIKTDGMRCVLVGEESGGKKQYLCTDDRIPETDDAKPAR